MSAAGMLGRHQSEPSRELSAVFELLGVPDRGDEASAVRGPIPMIARTRTQRSSARAWDPMR